MKGRRVSVRSAVTAGFVATVITSSMLLMKNALGAFKDVHIPQTISTMIGTPDKIMIGGITFFVICAVVLSLIYALIEPYLSFRSAWVKGAVFGFGVWLGMMFLFMPAAGAGFFASNRSAAVPAVDLVLTLVYGLIVAGLYSRDNHAVRKGPSALA